jgi:hypothetical protein
MNVTSTGLARAAGAAAATAGAIFIAVQVNHPAGSAFDTETSEWVARSAAKTVMAGLALAGITGIWLRQHRQAGLLGLVGYVVFAVGYLAMLSVQVIAATVLPTLLDSDPGYVMDVVHAAEGGAPAGDIGAMQVVLNVSGAGYILGGLLFGVALFRAGVLARWAAALLAASTVATATLAVLPEAFNRPLAVPAGLALIGLGVSLWRNPGRADDSRSTEAVRAVAEPAVR